MFAITVSMSAFDVHESSNLRRDMTVDIRLFLEDCIPLTEVEELNADQVAEWLNCTLSKVSKRYRPFDLPGGTVLSKMSSQQMQSSLDIPENIAGALYTFITRLSPRSSIDWPIHYSLPAQPPSPRYSQYPVFKDECQIPDLHEVYTELFGFTQAGTFVEIGAFDGRTWSNTFQVTTQTLSCASFSNRHRHSVSSHLPSIRLIFTSLLTCLALVYSARDTPFPTLRGRLHFPPYPSLPPSSLPPPLPPSLSPPPPSLLLSSSPASAGTATTPSPSRPTPTPAPPPTPPPPGGSRRTSSPSALRAGGT
jgi:hypothetical protein